MALADVCGFTQGPAFRSLGFQPEDFARDVAVSSKNLDENMVLACPPFEDVRNPFAKLRSLFTMFL